MDKENFKLLYIQTMDCIDTLINNSKIKNIKEIKLILKKIYNQYSNDITSLEELDYLDEKIKAIYNNHDNSDKRLIIYIRRLFYNYKILRTEFISNKNNK